MFAWLRRLRRREELPLTGAPAVRRIKTYSAASGYVYQYFYEGRRPAGRGMEYVFQVSADRRAYSSVAVTLDDEVLAAWQVAEARELSSSERYGVAKMALFQAFDERPEPARMREPIPVGLDDLARIADQLGLL